MEFDEEKSKDVKVDRKNRNDSSKTPKNTEDKKDVLKNLTEKEPAPPVKREPLSLEELLEKKKQMEEVNSKVLYFFILGKFSVRRPFFLMLG